MAKDAFGSVLRGEDPASASAADSADVTDQIDGYLDALYQGLAGLKAALDVLSTETGSAGEDLLPQDASDTFRQAQAAVFALRDSVDAELLQAGYDPTTA